MELFNDDTRHGFEHTLGWLRQWACSRSFGLGTWRVPLPSRIILTKVCPAQMITAQLALPL